MPLVIDKLILEHIFGTEEQLQNEIAAYAVALVKHAKTVGKPAPVAHPFVEEVVKFHNGTYLIEDSEHEAPPDVSEGFEPIKPPTPPPLTLDQMKAEVRWRLADRREQRVVEGVMYSGHRFSGHTHQLALIAATLALPGVILAEWMDADWEYINVDRATLTIILHQLVPMIHDCYRNEKRIAALINAAPTETKLKLITLEDGWPSL